MWPTTLTTALFRRCSQPATPLDDRDAPVLGKKRTAAILGRRQQRHQQLLTRRHQTRTCHREVVRADDAVADEQNPRTTAAVGPSDHGYSCNTLSSRCDQVRSRRSTVTGSGDAVCDVLAAACCSGTVTSGRDDVFGVDRRTSRLRVNSVVAAWRFVLGAVIVLQEVMMTGVRRFLARFSGRRRSYIPPFLRHHRSSPWRVLAYIVVYTSLISIADGCSSRNTPKPRPPPTPATAAATTARPNITFLTYECPPAYAAWYCLNGATCFTVKIRESLLYNCECSEGYMGPRCEYKDLDGSYLPSQRRILLETASIAGGATIAVLLIVVLGLVAYVHYYRRQRKEEPPTPPLSLATAQSTLTTTTDTVDGVTRTVTTSCVNTQAPRRLPTFGTRWKTQHQQQQQHPPNQQHNIAMTRVDLQQVTTLLGDCEQAQVQQTRVQLQRQC